MNGTPSDYVLLACATPGEAAGLIESVKNRRERTHAGKRVVEGDLRGVACRLTVAGVGVANTAHALTCQLDASRPLFVLQFGIGGAYIPSGVRVGEVLCATEEIYGDLGVLTPEGWKPMEEIGFPLVSGDPPRFNRFPLDAPLVRRAARIAEARAGIFLTVSQCTGIRTVGDALYERFHAVCENMEGAAAAQVCALYDMPFLELRGISNLVQDRDRSRWRIGDAVNAAHRAVESLFSRLDDLLR